MSTEFWAYLGIFLSLVAAGFGAPIPEEIPVVTAGALVGHPENELRWWIMLPLVITGVVLSDTVLYGIGRFWGPSLLQKKWARRLLPPEQQEKIEKNFHEYGIMILLAARLTPGIRTPVFIMSGVIRLPFYRFLLADGLYAIPGVNILFWLAFWFTDSFVAAVHSVERYRTLAVLVVVSALGGFMLYWLFPRRVATGAPAEIPIPIIGKQVEKIAHAHQAEQAATEAAKEQEQLKAKEVEPTKEGEKPPDAGPSVTPGVG